MAVAIVVIVVLCPNITFTLSIIAEAREAGSSEGKCPSNFE